MGGIVGVDRLMMSCNPSRLLPSNIRASLLEECGASDNSPDLLSEKVQDPMVMEPKILF